MMKFPLSPLCESRELHHKDFLNFSRNSLINNKNIRLNFPEFLVYTCKTLNK